MADFQLQHEGNLVGFIPKSEAAHDFIRNEVQAERWQFLGAVLYVDHRQAASIVEAAICDGLIIH